MDPKYDVAGVLSDRYFIDVVLSVMVTPKFEIRQWLQHLTDQIYQSRVANRLVIDTPYAVATLKIVSYVLIQRQLPTIVKAVRPTADQQDALIESDHLSVMHSVDIASRDDGQSGSPSATFPQKLFSMLLLNIDQGEIIHWLPHGLAFKVVDNEKFSEGVLPKYFKRESRTYRQNY